MKICIWKTTELNKSFFFLRNSRSSPSQWKGLGYGLHIMSAQPVVSHTGCCFVPASSQKWHQNREKRRGGKVKKERGDGNNNQDSLADNSASARQTVWKSTSLSDLCFSGPGFVTQTQDFFFIFSQKLISSCDERDFSPRSNYRNTSAAQDPNQPVWILLSLTRMT